MFLKTLLILALISATCPTKTETESKIETKIIEKYCYEDKIYNSNELCMKILEENFEDGNKRLKKCANSMPSGSTQQEVEAKCTPPIEETVRAMNVPECVKTEIKCIEI